MKKVKKRYTILFVILLFFGVKTIRTEVYKQKLMREEKPRIEKYLKYNFKNIQKITFTKVVINPTGVPHINGYINNDPSMSFDAGVHDDHFSQALNFYGEKKPENKFPPIEEFGG